MAEEEPMAVEDTDNPHYVLNLPLSCGRKQLCV